MPPKKTIQQREQELQTLLADATGRKELENLVSRYAKAGGRMKPLRGSIITYILVYERERGLISA